MNKLKYGLLILIGVVSFGSSVLAAPPYIFQKSVLPEVNNKYYLGTTTPSTNAWAGIVTGMICLTGDCRTTWPSGGSGTVATSSNETANYVPFWTTTNGYPATLSGGVSGFQWVNSLSKLIATNASTSEITVSGQASTSNLTASKSAVFNFLGTGLTKVTNGLLGLATPGTDYEVPLTFTTGLTRTVNTITCDTVNSSTFGCLTAAAFNEFRGKVSSSSLSGAVPITYSPTTGVIGFDQTANLNLTNLQSFGNTTGTTSVNQSLDIAGSLRVIGRTFLTDLYLVTEVFYNGITGPAFTATSTSVASIFPYASTTAVTIGGDGKSLDIGSGSNSLVYSTYAGGRAYMGYDGNNAFVQGGNTKNLVFNVNSATVGSGEAARLTTVGNLGVGTSTPTGRIVLANGTSAYSIDPASEGAAIQGNAANGVVQLKVGRITDGPFIQTYQNLPLLLNPGGNNIGIGSSTPTYLLSQGTGATAFSVSSTGVATSTAYNATSDTIPSIFRFATTTGLSVTGNAYFPTSGIWNSSGNVGINTVSPSAMLHINSTNGAGNTAKIIVQEARGAGNDASIQLTTTNNANDTYIQYTRSGVGSWVMGNDGSDSNSFKIDRATSLTTAAPFTILTSGEVGIKANTPTSTLDVIAPAGRAKQRIALSSADSNTAPTAFLTANYLQLGGQEYNAANTSPSYRLIGFGYNNGMDNNYSPAYLGYRETNNGGSTLGDLGFFTRAVTTGTTQPSERLTVTSAGPVGVGTTTPQFSLTAFSNSAAQLALSAGAGLAQWVMRNAGGNLYFATTTVAGTATSSPAALTLFGTGPASLQVGTTTCMATLKNGSLCLGGGGDSSGITGSTTVITAKYQVQGINDTGAMVCSFYHGTTWTTISGACNP